MNNTCLKNLIAGLLLHQFLGEEALRCVELYDVEAGLYSGDVDGCIWLGIGRMENPFSGKVNNFN